MPRLELRADDHLHSPELKREYTLANFQEVSKSYDFLTRALSFGRDQSWKRRLIKALPPMTAPVCLDLACGTGDLAFAVADRYPDATVVGLDLTPNMIAAANERNTHDNVRFEIGDMNQLGRADNSIDLITGGYALRNAPSLPVALDEIYRVLKPGGTAAFLDFSKSTNPFLQWLSLKILYLLGAFWGLVLHRQTEIYTYISKSLKLYPDRDSLHRSLADAGFKVKMSERFFIGTLEIFVLTKSPKPIETAATASSDETASAGEAAQAVLA